jgi:hypothetical protein
MNSAAFQEDKQANLPPLASLEEFIDRTSGQNRFLVLDCLGSRYFEGKLSSFGVEESACFRMPVHSVEGDDGDPLLVQLDEENAGALMQAALEEATKDSMRSPLGSRHISALVSSNSKPKHIARSFARTARYRIRGQQKTTAFRFFDPRVMHTLQRLFSPLQMAILLGHMTHWGYVDFRGQFRLIENSSPRSFSKAVLHDAQINVLHRNATVQTALHRLQKFRADWPEDLDAVLDHLLQRAPKELREADITQREDDLATYAALFWLCNTHRADRQLIGQALEENFKTGAPLKAVLEFLSPNLF